ncbi:stage 0 sporulation protein [Lysinibacillus yapensis]|uniref:Stage 0 sporulation protein n=1 Tax=Ureibacillus yapensis TaxID=2304605 RepID=A0A396S2U2_9BACL|nr:stage 0 sporulation family protein [Lysinibacillus yapensis]RHW31766.1 stage 0 sporulation protein [Lysinibacillus yapensis]
MYNVVGVRFKKAGKIYYFDPGEFLLEKGQYVIVETARGVEYGKIVVPMKQVGENDVVLPLKQVLRPADERDRIQVDENIQESRRAFELANMKILEHKLEMKLVDVEYTFDRNKIIFYFTAEGRVDFRELVKDLASIFRTRIELRQIGVRDEAKLLGGIGPCGRMLCCSTFLGDFDPVSIKMAKDQNLSLNPTKISGLCGRLMCCLKYENDDYENAKIGLPDIGDSAMTPDGPGKVVGINVLERIIQVFLEEQVRTVEYTLDEIIECEKNLI